MDRLDYNSCVKDVEENGKIKLIHTEVDSVLKGKGAGIAIVEKTLNYIEKSNIKLTPLCPFVAAYIKRHPEWKRIVAEGVKNI